MLEPGGAASGAKARAGAAAETMGRSDAEEATPRLTARRRGAAASYFITLAGQCASSSNRSHESSADV